MRRLTLLFTLALAVILAACSPVGSGEVSTADMEIQVVSISHGLGADVYVQAYRGASTVNMEYGDAFYLKQAGIEIEMEEVDSLQLFDGGSEGEKGKAYHAAITSLADAEIIFRRGTGEMIAGTTFTPISSGLVGLSPSFGSTYADGSAENLTWMPDKLESDEVTAALRLHSDSCIPNHSDFKMYEGIFSTTGPAVSYTGNATVADGVVPFEAEIGENVTNNFSCNAELRVYRISPDEFNLQVASAFKGVRSNSLGAYMHTFDFTWTN